MKSPTMVRAGAGLAGVAVIAGAFGAHGLNDRLVELEQLATFETAVRYQMWHALAVLLCAALQTSGLRTTAAVWCFVSGTTVFSGTLYVLSLSGVRWLGAITPIGGALMIAGWVCLCWCRPRPEG